MSRPAPTTIRDVARKAGVSLATVSRALNNGAHVTQATRSRVQSAANELGYSPHSGARSLITRRTNTLGVLLPDVYGEVFSELIRGLDRAAQRHHFHLLLASSHSDAQEIDAAVASMRGRVDGFIVMSPDTAALTPLATLARLHPTLVLGAPQDLTTFAAISVANFDGALSMMRHLISLGYRDIVFVRGPEGNAEATDRLRGAQAGAAETPGVTLREVAGDFRQGTGFVAARQLLRSTTLPDAIFCANDSMAVGAIAALSDAGVRVPDELAVVGFDDIPIARYLTPTLTTVRVPIAELGERAAERLITALEDGVPLDDHGEVAMTSLVVRASCGAAVLAPIRRSVP